MALYDSEPHLVRWLTSARIQQPDKILLLLHENDIFSVLQLLQSENAQSIVRNGMTVISSKRFDAALNESISNHQNCTSFKVTDPSPETFVSVDDLLVIDADPIVDTERASPVVDLERQVLLENFFIEYAIHLKCGEPVGCFSNPLCGEVPPKKGHHDISYVYAFSGCAQDKLTKSIEAHQERAKRLIELIGSRKGTCDDRLNSSQLGWTRKRSVKRAKKVAFDPYFVSILRAGVVETEAPKTPPPASPPKSEVPIAEQRRLERIRLDALKQVPIASGAEVSIQEQRRQERARLQALADSISASAGQWECSYCQMTNKREMVQCCACKDWRREERSPSHVDSFNRHEKESDQCAIRISKPAQVKPVDASAIRTVHPVKEVPKPPTVVQHSNEWSHGRCFDTSSNLHSADMPRTQRFTADQRSQESTDFAQRLHELQANQKAREAREEMRQPVTRSPIAVKIAAQSNQASTNEQQRQAATPGPRFERVVNHECASSSLLSSTAHRGPRRDTFDSDGGGQLQQDVQRTHNFASVTQRTWSQAVGRSDVRSDMYSKHNAPQSTYRSVVNASSVSAAVDTARQKDRPGQQPVSVTSYLPAARRVAGGASTMRLLPSTTYVGNGITLISGRGAAVGSDHLPQRTDHARSDQPSLQQQQHQPQERKQQSVVRRSHSDIGGVDRVVSNSRRNSVSSSSSSSSSSSAKQPQEQHNKYKMPWRP